MRSSAGNHSGIRSRHIATTSKSTALRHSISPPSSISPSIACSRGVRTNACTKSTAIAKHACRLGASNQTRLHPTCSPIADQLAAIVAPALTNPRFPETPFSAAGIDIIPRERFSRFIPLTQSPASRAKLRSKTHNRRDRRNGPLNDLSSWKSSRGAVWSRICRISRLQYFQTAQERCLTLPVRLCPFPIKLGKASTRRPRQEEVMAGQSIAHRLHAPTLLQGAEKHGCEPEAFK